MKKTFAVITLLCFLLTLLPTAAFAAGFMTENSTVYITDENKQVQIGEKAEFAFDFEGHTTKSVYVWFVKADREDGVPATSAQVLNGTATEIPGIYQLTSTTGIAGKEFQVSFSSTGTYKIAAATKNPYQSGKSIAESMRYIDDKIPVDSNRNTVVVKNNTESAQYTLQLIDTANLPWSKLQYRLTGQEEPDSETAKTMQADKIKNNGQAAIGAGSGSTTITAQKRLIPNGVPSEEITMKLLDKDGKAVKGATIKLSTSNSNCAVNQESVTTDQLGQFKFTITLTKESPSDDNFTIYLDCGAYSANINVMASSTKASNIGYNLLTKGAISTDDVAAGSELSDHLLINITDANGNYVLPFTMQQGGINAEPAFAGVSYPRLAGTIAETTDYGSFGNTAEDYVSIVSKPAGSTLENKDVWLCAARTTEYQATLYFKEALIAGDYTFKITLANGNYKTIDLKIAEMGTPVQIIATPKTAVVEVGGMGRATFKLADANGVTKKAIIDKDIDVSVSGYAVSRTEITDTAIKNFMNIYIKNDSKYQGSDIKVVATSDRYNLVGETTLKVTDGNAFIRIPITEAQTNKTIDMMCTLVTKDGLLAVNTNADRTAAYYGDNAVFEVIGGQTGFVVVSKPEGATVNFDASSSGGSATSLGKQGFEQVRIECDTPGVVTVKMTYGCKAKSGDGEWISYYYEGTQNIMFKDASAEKNVVMHIGSKEVVIDGSPSTIDAAPIVQNNRTYVPFRALAEAFGAEVAYDEATKAVTATLGGKTVVMTMQSDTYTVNGVEQIADVAPFINGSRTMVPVRFVAEAFGSTVTPTYNEHGATTDILFKL